MSELFDMRLRALRRDRAARIGPELFLFDRAFEDCLERIELVQRRFGQALLIGCPDPAWREGLGTLADHISVIDPGGLFADNAEGKQVVEDAWDAPAASFDLVLAIGTLDTVNDLRRALMQIRRSLQPDGLFIGAMSGGDTLPQLRSAMRAADQAMSGATAHVHPRVEASALAGLLGAAGFAIPVVDVDRVPVVYRSLDRLIRDLRAMGATNVLAGRSDQALSRTARRTAAEAFAAAGDGMRTTEIFEVLHFAAWAPAPSGAPIHA